jgi:hypothetical protein
MQDRYEICAWCKTWLNLAHSAYDVAREQDSDTKIYLHHSGCSRLWIEHHYGEILEEHIHDYVAV